MDEQIKFVVDHLKDRLAQAEAQVRAEREHNHRLTVACGLYRSGLCHGLTVARLMIDREANAALASASFDDMASDCQEADKILLPVAKEVMK